MPAFMKKTYLERALVDLQRRVKLLRNHRIRMAGRRQLPIMLRPRETAAALGIKVKELGTLRRLLPPIELFPNVIRYRSEDLRRLLAAEAEMLIAYNRMSQTLKKKTAKR